MQPLYVGVQVHARAYYAVRARACVWLVVDVARPCVPVAAATVAVYYQNVTTSTLHAIGPHGTVVPQPLDHPVFRSRYFASLRFRLFAIGTVEKLKRKRYPRISRIN